MIISGGVNIYPAEIEAAIFTLAGVGDCAVLGIPDPIFGEQVMAVVEPAAGARLTPESVRAHVGRQLADFKVPRRIELRDHLPREDSRQDSETRPPRALLARRWAGDLS